MKDVNSYRAKSKAFRSPFIQTQSIEKTNFCIGEIFNLMKLIIRQTELLKLPEL